MKIALYGRKIAESGAEGLRQLLEGLVSKGAELCYNRSFYEYLSNNLGPMPEGSFFETPDEIPEQTSLILSLGGDGTFLRSVPLLRGRRIPVAGINFGTLGFLTTAKMTDADNDWISDLASGHWKIEERMLLQADVTPDILPKGFYPFALNEVTIHRITASMLQIDIAVDGRPLPSYRADGVVIATPTGSTAYSLSVGGPVATPDSRLIILAPIAPHNLNIRPLVVSSESKIEVSFMAKGGRATVSVDNRSFEAPSGTKIVIGSADYTASCVSLGGQTFIDALRDKLLWGEDIRNNS